MVNSSLENYYHTVTVKFLDGVHVPTSPPIGPLNPSVQSVLCMNSIVFIKISWFFFLNLCFNDVVVNATVVCSPIVSGVFLFLDAICLVNFDNHKLSLTNQISCNSWTITQIAAVVYLYCIVFFVDCIILKFFFLLNY